MHGFQERGFIDHHNLRHLQDYLSGEQVNEPLLREKVEQLEANLEKAAALGMNSYVIFSRGFELIHTYDSLGDRVCPAGSPARKRAEMFGEALGKVLHRGRELGLKMVFHTNQFMFPEAVYAHFGDRLGGEARICPGRELVWELFRTKVEEFLERFPRINALQFTTSETQVSVTSCRCPDCADLSATDRFLRFAREAHSACARRGVECQVRTWGSLGDRETYEAFCRDLPPGLVISTKNTAWDFHLPSPVNELIGRGKAPQVVEFDAWGEYFGWNRFPCYMGEEFAERLRYCAQHGIDRVHVRINWNPGTDWIFGVPFGNGVNVFLFSALSRDPYRSPDDLLAEWVGNTFGRTRVDDLCRFYRNTRRVQWESQNFLGHPSTSHTCLFYNRSTRDYESRIRSMIGPRSAGMLAEKPELIPLREAALQQTWDDVQTSLKRLREAMPAEWYEELRHRAECQRFVSLANTGCLKLFVCMVLGSASPFDAQAVGSALRPLLADWVKHDPRHATWMEWWVADEIYREAMEKQKGIREASAGPEPPGTPEAWAVRK